MKIRKKLILSFILITGLAITSFGGIAYHTFANHILRERDEFLCAKSRELVNTLENNLINEVLTLEPYIRDIIREQIAAGRPYAPNAQRRARAVLKRFRLIDDFWIFQMQENEASGGKEPMPPAISKFLSRHRGSLSADHFLLVPKGEKLFLMVRLPRLTISWTLLFEIDKSGLKSLIKKLLPSFETSCFLTSKNEAILSVNAKTPWDTIKMLPEVKKSNLHTCSCIKLLKNLVIFTPSIDFMGLKLHLLVEKGVIYQHIIELKDEIIVAALIVGWISIWIILIVSYRLTAPLNRLIMAVDQIIAEDFETPLDIEVGSDEVGILAKRFERMRRRLKELVCHDPLTGVFNRRHFLVLFEKLVEQARREGGELACMMLDIDDFKIVNDTYGHQCGDKMLRGLGELLLRNIRKYDVVARYGGEEFVILLPNTDLRTAEQIAERIRMAVKELRVIAKIGGEERSVHVTISIGIATLFQAPDRVSNGEELLNRADDALYAAKKTGKDKVVKWSPI